MNNVQKRDERDIALELIQELLHKTFARLKNTFYVQPADYRVSIEAVGSCVYVQEILYKLDGVVKIEIATGWPKYKRPTSRRSEDDLFYHAGSHVLEPIGVRSTVSLSALNKDTIYIIDFIDYARTFARRIRDTELWLKHQLQSQKHRIGKEFLATLPLPPAGVITTTR